MVLYDLYNQYRFLVWSLSTAIILVSCLVIYVRTRKLYELSAYEGIRYFRNAFLYYGAGFLIVYILNILSLTGLAPWLLNPVRILEEYLLQMAGFFLIYSLLWKTLEGYSQHTRVVMLHGLAIIVAFVDYFANASIMFPVQILLFMYAAVISYNNYARATRRNFLQLYFIGMVLSLVGWMVNYASLFIFNAYPIIVFYTDVINTLIFLIFLYGVILTTRS